MSIANEITALTTKLTTIFDQIKTAFGAKGVSGMPSDYAEVPAKIDSIVVGEGQGFDVTLNSESTNVLIPNVVLPNGGSFTGAALYAVSGVADEQEGVVYAATKYPQGNAISNAVDYYDPGSNSHRCTKTGTSSIVGVYDSTHHTLTITFGNSSYKLKPGSYHIIVW